MRVIAGIYRGRKLKTVAGNAVRPTSDRLRETLFNVLSPEMAGARFLDLCAGSGAVGIEAMSRGAEWVTFVDVSRHACAIVEENLEALGIDFGTEIINKEATAAIRLLGGREEKYDIAFLDPPYEGGAYSRIMKAVAAAGIIAPDGMLVVEHRARTPPESEFGDFRAYRLLTQGESALAFYCRL